MKKTLVVLAAGMGSRFGGLKQIEPVGPSGEFIIDYSVYDALKAGFNKCVFVIRKENYEIFKNTIGKRLENKIEVDYAFQELDVLPRKVEVHREKQFGTGHALYCAKDKIEGPFALISSDDYYGQDSFKELSEFLDNNKKVAVVGYKIGDTILGDEVVKRGVILENNNLITGIKESKVSKNENGVLCEPLNGDESFEIKHDDYASMLMYGFNVDNFFDILEAKLNEFLDKANLDVDEFYLPDVIDSMIKDNKVALVKTTSKWMGMTYKEDLEKVKNEINEYIEKGTYNKNLWEA